MRAERLRLLAGLVLALWLVLPLVPLAIWSFAHGWRFPDLLPQAWSLKAWRHALSDASGVLDGLWTSLLVALAATFLGALVALPAGRALGLYQFRGKRAVLLLLTAPAIVPSIAILPGLQAVFLNLGLTGSLTGVTLAHLIPVIPYMTLILAAVFARFDPAHEDQARLMGARPWQVLVHVTLPAVRPGLATACLFAFLISWAQYLPTLVIGGGRVQTLPLTLYGYAAAGRNDLAAAIALIGILPGLVVLALTLRQMNGSAPVAGRGLMP